MDLIPGRSGDGSIRSYLGSAIGQRIAEITCDDECEPQVIVGRAVDDGNVNVFVDIRKVYLHLENGTTITFHAIEEQLGFLYDGDT